MIWFDALFVPKPKANTVYLRCMCMYKCNSVNSLCSTEVNETFAPQKPSNKRTIKNVKFFFYSLRVVAGLKWKNVEKQTRRRNSRE